MIGINVENLDTLIKKNNLYLTSIKNNGKKIINSTNELCECYCGNSLEYLFNEPMKQINNIQTICDVIENYSNILSGVKISYKKQDEIFQSKFNHMKSNLQ